MLGTYHHSIFYIQEYIPKPERDIRFVVGDETICAIYRTSEHLITNGARRQVDQLSGDAGTERTVRSARRAVGGGIVAID